jgi:hypothetical protein
MHIKGGKPIKNIRCLDKLDPIELDILARGEMAKSTIKVTRNTGQTAKLIL